MKQDITQSDLKMKFPHLKYRETGSQLGTMH